MFLIKKDNKYINIENCLGFDIEEVESEFVLFVRIDVVSRFEIKRGTKEELERLIEIITQQESLRIGCWKALFFYALFY